MQAYESAWLFCTKRTVCESRKCAWKTQFTTSAKCWWLLISTGLRRSHAQLTKGKSAAPVHFNRGRIKNIKLVEFLTNQNITTQSNIFYIFPVYTVEFWKNSQIPFDWLFYLIKQSNTYSWYLRSANRF